MADEADRDNCPECGRPLPNGVVCNIHGTFCSRPCIDAATERGYPKRIAEALDQLETCFLEAPVDFVGTGTNDRYTAKAEREWEQTWKKALADLKSFIKGDKP